VLGDAVEGAALCCRHDDVVAGVADADANGVDLDLAGDVVEGGGCSAPTVNWKL